MECTAGAGLRGDPDAPAVALDHFLADGEADTGARVLGLVVQTLEHHEDALEILRLDTDAIVADGELEVGFLFDAGDVDPGHRRRAELERVADQVLEQLRQLRFVGAHPGQRVPGHRCARLLDGAAQVADRLVERWLHLDRQELLAAGADARVGKQVLDQLLHARGDLDHEAHDLLGVAVEPVAVATLYQLRIARHHAQRLLQVVRGDVGELLELGIGALELVVRLRQRHRGALALGDVVEDGDLVERRRGVVAHQRDHDFGPHYRTVRAQVALLEAYRLRFAGDEAPADRIGHVAILRVRDLLHRSTDQLRFAAAKDLAQAAVDAREAAVDHVGNAGRGQLEGLAEARLALAQRHLGVALRGDVADGRDDAVPVGLAGTAQEGGVHRQPGQASPGALDADDIAGQPFAAAQRDARRPVLLAQRPAVGVHAGQQRGETGGADDVDQRQADDAFGGLVAGDDVEGAVVDQDAFVAVVDHRAEALLAVAQAGLGALARRDIDNDPDQAVGLAALAAKGGLVVDGVALLAGESGDRRLVALAAGPRPQLHVLGAVQRGDRRVLRVEVGDFLAEKILAADAEEFLPGLVHRHVTPVAALDEHRQRQRFHEVDHGRLR